MLLKFFNGLLKSPTTTEDPKDLARAYSDCQNRITVLRSELERILTPYQGYVDDTARGHSELDSTFAGLQLIRANQALRAEVARSDDLKSRLDALCCQCSALGRND